MKMIQEECATQDRKVTVTVCEGRGVGRWVGAGRGKAIRTAKLQVSLQR